MAKILHIETSTTVCSVALSVDGRVVFDKVSFEGSSHAALLGVFVEETIAYSQGRQYQPEAIALSGGPGSYTGLRIGASMAKGLCMGWDVPLIAVPTLQVMASQAIRLYGKSDCLYCAMLDARRMEVYAAIYDATLSMEEKTSADIITSDSYRSFLDRSTVCFFGSGAAKCSTMIKSDNASYYVYRAQAQIHQNKIREAIASLENALVISPNDANIRNNLNALKAQAR